VKKKILSTIVIIGVVAASAGVNQAIAASSDKASVERGKYLVKFGGCNDCHTPGYLMSEGKVPEQQWLTGDSFGWSGPWGTTYASNLRNKLNELSEDEWLSFARQLKARPPMPWFTLNQLEEDDLRSIYRFIRSLGPAGKAAPDYLPPGKEPPPPFALFPSPPPSK